MTLTANQLASSAEYSALISRSQLINSVCKEVLFDEANISEKCASISRYTRRLASGYTSSVEFRLLPRPRVNARNFYPLKGPNSYSFRVTQKKNARERGGGWGNNRTRRNRTRMPPSKCTFHLTTKYLPGKEHPPDDALRFYVLCETGGPFTAGQFARSQFGLPESRRSARDKEIVARRRAARRDALTWTRERDFTRSRGKRRATLLFSAPRRTAQHCSTVLQPDRTCEVPLPPGPLHGPQVHGRPHQSPSHRPRSLRPAIASRLLLLAASFRYFLPLSWSLALHSRYRCSPMKPVHPNEDARLRIFIAPLVMRNVNARSLIANSNYVCDVISLRSCYDSLRIFQNLSVPHSLLYFIHIPWKDLDHLISCLLRV